jgi:hypothetical protein
MAEKEERVRRNEDSESSVPTGAIGDSSDPRTASTDPNGAQTAVGVPHPENRGRALDKIVGRDALGAVLPELDDYDADRAEGEVPDLMPPDQDDGRSYAGIADVGEQAGVTGVSDKAHTGRSDPAQDADLVGRASNTPSNVTRPTVDNQTNQPKRFQRPTRKTT